MQLSQSEYVNWDCFYAIDDRFWCNCAPKGIWRIFVQCSLSALVLELTCTYSLYLLTVTTRERYIAITKRIEHKVSYGKPCPEISENSFADSNIHCITVNFVLNARYLLQRPGHIAYDDILPSIFICVTLIAYFYIRIFSKSSVVNKSKSARCLPLSRFSKREIWPRQLVDFSRDVFARTRPDITPKCVFLLDAGLPSVEFCSVPFVYCFRIRHFRNAVLELLKMRPTKKASENRSISY